ncbi:type II toxin-antitoxin system PemK/MazF family toxin [Nocardia terpenica]|uniref:type II toxin-antitoxin system PemK/MazF family toxin n=1 Tax=Nocardia terpenica TaxID=455432 RepID=UPI002FE029E8
MRPIHIAKLDKRRPVLVLTRDAVRPYLNQVTVAPITSTVRGTPNELEIGAVNGIDHGSVANLDLVTAIPVHDLGNLIGYLRPDQEAALSAAIRYAYDLK